MHSLTYYDSRLSAHADSELSKKRTRALKVTRGIRGAPARLIAELLEEDPTVDIETEIEQLHRLFMTAHEDGMIAIGLLSVAVLKEPELAAELAERWLGLIDDVESADALGWTVLGPLELQLAGANAQHYRQWPGVYAKRAWITSLMAALPEAPKGPHVAALRAHLGAEQVVFVDAPVQTLLQEAFPFFITEENHTLRKAIAALIRSWATFSPEAVSEVINAQRENLPRWLREPYERGERRYRRAQR